VPSARVRMLTLTRIARFLPVPPTAPLIMMFAKACVLACGMTGNCELCVLLVGCCVTSSFVMIDLRRTHGRLSLIAERWIVVSPMFVA
jgi:hypothetical protein